ncbi:MAG: ATP-binding cassette domain-containing protein [Helicobacteraceae bacterium]|jgi:subfamily B ATP-binding cassette protein MsbA|nr:ATP-binding cassette domain-containing protein [Helicobacteraceae bacterium]
MRRKTKKKEQKQQIVKRIWREHTRKYLTTLIGVIILTALIGGAEAYSVSLLKPVFDDGFFKQNYEILKFLCAQIVIIYIAKGMLQYIHSLVMTHVSTKTIQSIQKRVFRHLLTLDLQFFNKNSSGQMLARILNDCGAISNIAITFITTVFKNIITCLAMFGLMIYYSWELFLIIVIFIPIGAIFMESIKKRVKRQASALANSNAAMVSKLSESLQSVKIIKSYNMEEYERKNLESIYGEVFNLVIKNNKIRSSITPFIESMSGFILASIIMIGGYQVSVGGITTGAFVTFLGAWVAAYAPLKSIMSFRASFQMALISAERVYSVIDTPPSITDIPDAKELKEFKNAIEIKNVSFKYENGAEVLKNITMTVKRGSTVALVGASGGGKTTLISLVPRFFDVTEGTILIDGVDIRNITQKSLRSHISYVSQETILFDDTIAKNIAYGKGIDADAVSEDDIKKAAKNAYADIFIEQFENGYQTKIGEKGVRLSGGQKQRISIARALIKDAEILLLDEATSALDSESEREVQSALDNLMKNRTTIVIAHRLSTIINADRIFLIDGGAIAESGTHQELLALNKKYAKLYNAQLSKKDKEAVSA